MTRMQAYGVTLLLIAVPLSMSVVALVGLHWVVNVARWGMLRFRTWQRSHLALWQRRASKNRQAMGFPVVPQGDNDTERRDERTGRN